MKAHVLALLCALCLAACGGGGGQQNDDQDDESVNEPQLIGTVLFHGSISEPPTGFLTFSIEGAGRVALGSVGSEEGVTKLTFLDTASGRGDYALLVNQLTDGDTTQGLLVDVNRGGVVHSLGSGDDGSMLVRLAPQAASGQLDLVGHEVTALQAIVRVEHKTGRFDMSGAVQVFGYPPRPSADGERALALVPFNLSLIGRAALPGRIQLSNVTLANLEDSEIGLQDMLREADDPVFAPLADTLTDGTAAQLATTLLPNDAPPTFRPRSLLPLVDLSGEDLAGFEITGLRYHSWNAYNFHDLVPKEMQLDGAAVIYGRLP